jgi:hypothetical protein
MELPFTRRSEVSTSNDDLALQRRAMIKKLDSIGWGLFFIWIGVALLVDLGWGVTLLGVGIIAIGEQMARRYFGNPIEGFWFTVGILFVISGLWELLNLGDAPIVPTLSIIVGLVLLVSALRGSD